MAEKPSIALALANALGNNDVRKRMGIAPRSPVYEYRGDFLGEAACFKVTATHGHIYSFDFGGEYNDWSKHGPRELFSAPVVRTYDSAAQMPEHIREEAKGCHALVLWLDCDREGENICFEVMQITYLSIYLSLSLSIYIYISLSLYIYIYIYVIISASR